MMLFLWVVSGAILLVGTVLEFAMVASGERDYGFIPVSGIFIGGVWAIWAALGTPFFHAP